MITRSKLQQKRGKRKTYDAMLVRNNNGTVHLTTGHYVHMLREREQKISKLEEEKSALRDIMQRLEEQVEELTDELEHNCDATYARTLEKLAFEREHMIGKCNKRFNNEKVKHQNTKALLSEARHHLEHLRVYRTTNNDAFYEARRYQGCHMQLFAICPNGLQKTLDVKPSDTVTDLKRLLEIKSGHPMHKIHIKWNDAELEDAHTITKCGILNENKIIVIYDM